MKLRLGRVATEPELAKELGMSLEDFQHLLGELRGLDLGSLQAESMDPQAEEDVVSYRPGGSEKDPFFLCLHGEIRSHIASALDDLDEKEKQVVTLYYLEELTMKEVGAVLGVGESRVSQIHSAAIVRLRARLAELIASPRADAGSRARARKPVWRTGMEKILTQEEIDALISRHAERPDPALGGTTQRKKMSPSSISAKSARSTRNRCARCPRCTKVSRATSPIRWAPILRVGFDVNLVSVEQLTFSEIVSRLPELTYLCSMRMQAD